MKIVIDIDDEDYNRIQGISDVFNSLTSRAYSSIRNGKPLEYINAFINDIMLLWDKCHTAPLYWPENLEEDFYATMKKWEEKKK